MIHSIDFNFYMTCTSVGSELADIILNEEQEHIIREANAKRAVIADLSHISSDFSKPWVNGIIPYVIDPKITGGYD